MSNATTPQEINELLAAALAGVAQSLQNGVPLAVATAEVSAAFYSSASSTSMKVGDALTRYWTERSGQWAKATIPDATLALGWLKEHLGEDTHLAMVKKAQAASFRAGLLRLEKHSKASDFLHRQTDDPSRRISAVTSQKYLNFAKGFFTWCADEAGLIEYSVFAKLTIKPPKRKSKAAAAATPKALIEILNSPLFQGHRVARLHKRGSLVTRRDYYWAALLQFYFGARIGEIAQLRVSDVYADADIPYVHIRVLDEDGQPIRGNTLKNQNSTRKLPVCDDLIALGFLGFVRSKRLKAAYLFPDIAPSRGQKSSSKASKWWARYLSGIGQKAEGKASHWLRHALFTALRSASVPPYLISQISGQAQTGMQGNYGSFEDLRAAKEAMDSADYGFNPRAILEKSRERWTR